MRLTGGILAAAVAIGVFGPGQAAMAADITGEPTITEGPGTDPGLSDNGEGQAVDEPDPNGEPEAPTTPGAAEDPKEGPDPAEEPEVTAIPEPTEGSDPSPTGEPGTMPGPAGDPEDTPTPAEEPEATKAPKPSPAGEPGTTPEPTGDPEDMPAPTEEPEATKAPKPTKKPKPSPTGEPDEPAEPTEEITPTPTASPTPKPKYSVNLPTESNDARYQYLLGINAREITMKNPPKGYESAAAAARHMVTINVPVWKMTADGKKYSSTYKLTINAKLEKCVKAIFKEIYALDIRFPVKVLIGYYYRRVGGVGLSNSTLMSVHSFGAAIDINPGDYDNDYFLGKGNDLRDKSNPYCIPDEVIEIFEKYGWFWGGNFEICTDTMHFQYLGLEFLTYQGNPPFRTLKISNSYMKGADVRNLQQRLCELGYKVTIDGVYGNKTASAIKKYQKQKGLPVTGEVDYKTWETIINETHYMSYVF